MIRCESPSNPKHVRFFHRYDLGMRKWAPKVGDTYTCWYNPDDPSEAKLSDEVATPVIAFVCYPMFLLFACVPACAMRKTMKDLCRG